MPIWIVSPSRMISERCSAMRRTSSAGRSRPLARPNSLIWSARRTTSMGSTSARRFFGDCAGNVPELGLGLFIDGLVYEGVGLLGGEDGRGVVDKVVNLGDVDVVLAVGADGAFVHLGYDGAGIFGGLALAPEVGAEAAETVSIGGRDYG